MARKNLRNQMRTAIFNDFHEGRDKRAEKAEDRGKIGVYSYGTRNDLLDKMNVWGRFLSAKGVKDAENVTGEHVRAFLEGKAAEGCTQRTLDAYRSAISRVGSLMGQDWRTDRVEALPDHKASRTRGAESVISKEDREKICDYCRSHPSGSASAILLEREIGVRVGDVAYGVREKNGQLEIRGKANRICTREITPVIRTILDGCPRDDTGRYTFPKDGTINKQLSRIEVRLGLEKHSFHDMRRCNAQEHYDGYRRKGLSPKEALRLTGVWLSHGDHREAMMLQSYVLHVW